MTSRTVQSDEMNQAARRQPMTSSSRDLRTGPVTRSRRQFVGAARAEPTNLAPAWEADMAQTTTHTHISVAERARVN